MIPFRLQSTRTPITISLVLGMVFGLWLSATASAGTVDVASAVGQNWYGYALAGLFAVGAVFAVCMTSRRSA